MYNNVVNKTAERTKKALADAFVKLIESHLYEKITITDICKQADVVRKTFYNNFKSKDDIVRYLINSIFDEMESRVDLNSLNTKRILLTLFSFIMDNRDSLLLFYKRGLIRFADECISDYVISAHILDIYDKRVVSEKAYKYIAACISSVLLSVVETWIKNNFAESIEFLAEITEALMYKPIG